METVTVKIEPPDEYGVTNGSTLSSANGTSGIDSSSPGSSNGSQSHDNRNFTCLLCDVVCDNRDELRKHLKITHASKHHVTTATSGMLSESTFSGFSSYSNYRYTCSICGAKLKTFRRYLSHSLSHRGSFQTKCDEARMATILSSGKQYLQDFVDSDDGYPGTFACDECKTVFMQRDAYAMHMMTRAMNLTCQAPVLQTAHVIKPENSEADEIPPAIESNGVSESSTKCEIPVEEPSAHASQRCLEDVTSRVDQDEYLKSVLDKVFFTEDDKTAHFESSGLHAEDRKVCAFCCHSFVDQDSLAMHVMSDHAEQMTLPSNKKKHERHLKAKNLSSWALSSQTMLNFSCKYCGEMFLSRDSLAMHVLTHAHKNDNLNRYAHKRAYDAETNLKFSSSPKAKILRTIGRFNQLAFKQTLLNGQTPPNSDSDTNSLHCNTCDIQFYARSEYDWHQRRHLENKINNHDEPLCLKKKPTDTPAEIKINGTSENHDSASIRQRRNSFSFNDNTRHVQTTEPRRPLSAGDCTTNGDNSGSIDVTKTAGKSNSSPDEVLSVPNINALSSNEQRIFYSVFGKDLNTFKNLDTSKQNGHTTIQNTNSPGITTTSPNPPNDQPKDLTLSRSETPSTTSGSGYTNGDSDCNSIVSKLVKDTPMCKYCEILFLNRAIYYLHMGLHNVNNPWQCNVCGKICSDAVDFAAHVIHM